ncbi:BMP family ABC transporter substrate-binding protein [Cytobacillus oceanisediminis]|uniref:BMP family ABC transporter substrate-binding protein n=1 Tax=Cytobacillus oceanisediminis TaxID=665099 RepID=UPI001CC9DB04|nr:BMP family ABC transporter substrate-binding protein [Cytobacillus oceanisediminis]MBZ9533113.1 BMP family ABC transporter substrate-binding protein [Cytobacillus oceanisediminis]
MKSILTNIRKSIFRRKIILIIPIIACVLFLFLFFYDSSEKKGKIDKVGLFVAGTVSDQAWGTQGYKGLLNIHTKLGLDVFYKESIDSYTVAERAVKEFQGKGVNLIFGHGGDFVQYFNILANKYPSIHFVSLNGRELATQKNTSNIRMENYPMGFFGGMVAGYMTRTNTVGVIGAYEWQEEASGFEAGVHYINKDVRVLEEFVNDWDDREKAMGLLDNEISQNVDIVYPIGDGFHVDIIERMKENGLYAIGYISDQSTIGKYTVLTSIIQDIPKLYGQVAQAFDEGKLKAGNQLCGIRDNTIFLGEFSPNVDKDFVEILQQELNRYKKTGKLPNEN